MTYQTYHARHAKQSQKISGESQGRFMLCLSFWWHGVWTETTSRTHRKKTLDRRQTDWIKGQERVRPMGLVGAVGLRLEDGRIAGHGIV